MASIIVEAPLEFDAGATAQDSTAGHDSANLLGDHLNLALVPVADTAPVLGDILDDAIFGEELDISDLIPALLSADPGSTVSQVADIDVASPMSGHFKAAAQLNVLFEEDATFGHGTI
jgi:hypothetical protein